MTRQFIRASRYVLIAKSDVKRIGALAKRHGIYGKLRALRIDIHEFSDKNRKLEIEDPRKPHSVYRGKCRLCGGKASECYPRHRAGRSCA